MTNVSNKNEQKVWKSVYYDLSMGDNLSVALEKRKDSFPKLLINMIKTAELTGDLTATLDDIIYPMYIPTNTYLTTQEKVQLDTGERAILTFEGDSSFTLIQETITVTDDYTTELVSGEPYILVDGIAIVNDYSVNWQSKGVDYYLMSNDLSSSELVSIANSLNSITVTGLTK